MITLTTATNLAKVLEIKHNIETLQNAMTKEPFKTTFEKLIADYEPTAAYRNHIFSAKIVTNGDGTYNIPLLPDEILHVLKNRNLIFDKKVKLLQEKAVAELHEEIGEHSRIEIAKPSGNVMYR